MHADRKVALHLQVPVTDIVNVRVRTWAMRIQPMGKYMLIADGTTTARTYIPTKLSILSEIVN